MAFSRDSGIFFPKFQLLHHFLSFLPLTHKTPSHALSMKKVSVAYGPSVGIAVLEFIGISLLVWAGVDEHPNKNGSVVSSSSSSTSLSLS